MDLVVLNRYLDFDWDRFSCRCQPKKTYHRCRLDIRALLGEWLLGVCVAGMLDQTPFEPAITIPYALFGLFHGMMSALSFRTVLGAFGCVLKL